MYRSRNTESENGGFENEGQWTGHQRRRNGRGSFPRINNYSDPLYEDVEYMTADDFEAISTSVIDKLVELYNDEADPSHARRVMQARVANYSVELYKQLSWDRIGIDDGADKPLDRWRQAWIDNAREQCALNLWCAAFMDDPANWFMPLVKFGVIE